MLTLMPNSARQLMPHDQDEADRQRQTALMGLRARIAGGMMGLNPNDPDYLAKLERMGSASHLMGLHDSRTAAAAAKPPAAMEAGLRMSGAGAAPPVGETPSTEPAPSVAVGKPILMARPRPAAEPAPDLARPVMGELSPDLMGGANVVNPRVPPVRPERSFMGKVGHGLERALYHIGDVAGTVFAPEAMAVIPGSTVYKNVTAERAERNRLAEARAESELMGARARLMGTPEEQAFRYGLGRGETPTQAYRELHPPRTTRETTDEQLIKAEETLASPAASTEEKADAQRYIDATKAGRAITHPAPGGRILSNPFEAVIYGTPEQKKAAQDFIAFEKKVGARYRQPTEFDERYRLFTQHPDIYKAMYGTKGGISPAEARMMLNYFDKRRQEINKDFTLSDTERQQALQELEQLEQPFMDAARGAAGQGAGAPEGDTVAVISPKGVRGTVPRANLQKALKRGYKLAR